MQDKIGPRIVATMGGILVGLGFIIASMTTSLAVFVIGFGVLAGAGIGFGYASATPPAVKWFPAAKTGLIAGIVVSGFGLCRAADNIFDRQPRFQSRCADGLKNFGMNYGLVFTAWGVGGFMLAKLAGAMYVKYQTFAIAYYGASTLLILAAIMTLLVKAPRYKIESAEA